MKHYLYCVEDKFTGEFYWGSRSCKCDPKDDDYMGSMCGWKPIKENLVKIVIIEYPDRESANKAESFVIAYYIDKKKFPLNRNYFIPNVGFCTQGMKKPYISENNKKYKTGFKHTEETKKKISESNKGKNLGKKPSVETIKKSIEVHKGSIPWNKGKHSTTEETKQKLRKARLGKKLSEETKQKLRGRIPWNKKQK